MCTTCGRTPGYCSHPPLWRLLNAAFTGAAVVYLLGLLVLVIAIAFTPH